MSVSRLRSATIALASALLIGGCALSFDARSLGVAASMAAPATQPMAGDTFAITTKAIHAFWGLYPVRSPNLQNVLASQTTGGAGIANLRIRIRRSLSDILITVLTAGVVDPASVTFEGVIVPGGQ